MRKTPLAVFIGGLAVAAAVTLITAPSSSGEQPGKKRVLPPGRSQIYGQQAYAQSRDDLTEASMPVVVFAPRYGSSPRIIHVPQADQEAQANANVEDEAVGTVDAGDAIPALPQVRRIKPATRN